MKLRKVRFVKSGTQPKDYPEPMPEFAFCGRSNVGKSSLLNSLMERKNLVKVSGKPGHTRLLNWFEVNDEVLLCDLPGYGFARVPPAERAAWGRMINTYLTQRQGLMALVVLIDVRRGFQEDDLNLVHACSALQLQPILVATKIDKLKSNELQRQKRAIAKEAGMDAEKDIIWYSSVTHEGREALWKRIESLIPRELQPLENILPFVEDDLMTDDTEDDY